MRQMKLIIIVSLIVLVLIAAKTVVHALNFEIIALTGLVTALIGGVTFTISILLAGTLPDYKESEKIPGDIALSIKSLYKDARIVASKDKKVREKMQQHIRNVMNAMLENFKNGTWKQSEINKEIDLVDDDIARLAESGVQPNYIIKIRNEVSNIERLSNRVETIKETQFMPAAYTIARLVVAMVLVVLIFVKVEPYYEGLTITAIIDFLLVGLVYLIRDIDDPFEKENISFADVELEHLFKVQRFMEAKNSS